MKLLLTSDIHQMISKWKNLVKVCQDNSFDYVLIAGDLFPKDEGILDQIRWTHHLRKYAENIKETGAIILLMLGNDDNQLLIPDMELGEKDGLWHFMHEKSINLNGIEFAGIPYVPDYPFGYKFWCRAESSKLTRLDSMQFGNPSFINDKNNFYHLTLHDYKLYLEKHPSIEDVLAKVENSVKNVENSIWMIHAPPANYGLDVCSHGQKVGSYAVLDFIEKKQPFLTIHGHIHESPEKSGIWKANIGNTLAIQGGQLGYKLHYAVAEIDDWKIKSICHSIY